MVEHPASNHPMSAHCCGDAACSSASADPWFRKALWVALVLNALMFVVELGASWTSGSVSLLADSIDFFGDAGNYAISLVVLGMGVPTGRRRRSSRRRAWAPSACSCSARRCGP